MDETIFILMMWPLAGLGIWFWMGVLGINLPNGKIANILLILALPLIVMGLLCLAILIFLLLWKYEGWVILRIVGGFP